MPKNKRNRLQPLIEFFWPTQWKLIGVVVLYFGSYLFSFFGFIINYPIYVLFYWGRQPAGMEALAILLLHVVYLYVLTCVLSRLLR